MPRLHDCIAPQFRHSVRGNAKERMRRDVAWGVCDDPGGGDAHRPLGLVRETQDHAQSALTLPG